MTVSQIIHELNHLSNFLYIYWEPHDEKDHMVILGGHSCMTKKEHTGIINAMHCNFEMQEIFEKKELDESDKYALVKLMRRMYSICDYRDYRLYSLAQQEEYLKKLSAEQLEEISKQIDMHKLAKELCREYR